MRLTNFEIQAINQSAQEIFGANSRVFLFGSRIDDLKKGGDIDLLLLVDESEYNLAKSKKFQFLDQLMGKIGEQRIDLVISTLKRMESDLFLSQLNPVELS